MESSTLQSSNAIAKQSLDKTADITDNTNIEVIDTEETNPTMTNERMQVIEEQAIEILTKPNVPNVNVPERIIICVDVCYADQQSLYRLGDGTTFTPINMIKKVLDFFISLKFAINKKTVFALLILKGGGVCWFHNFTNNLKELANKIENITIEDCTEETFSFNQVFELIKQKVDIPEYKEANSMLPPPYVVRMIVLYGRSNCVPIIPIDNPYFKILKKQLYFYIDIILAHEEDCILHKCEEIYDALQDLDNGYSYVFEVSRNATKIHDCIAKLLAHPLQRPLQKNTKYSFGSCHM